MDVRVLIDVRSDETGRLQSGEAPGDQELSHEELRDLYVPPSRSWLRANMVATVDGAARGPDGRTGSINNAADKRVFDLLRAMADAVLVGAGTAREERYRADGPPLVLVSRRGAVPERLAPSSRGPGEVWLVTCATAPGLAASRELLGEERVLVVGEDTVDLAAVRGALAERGMPHLLCEGGPELLGGLVAADAVDELCLTWVPRLLGADHPRILTGITVDVAMRPALLLEEQGTLMGRWLLDR